MYRPHYLNVDRERTDFYAGNQLYKTFINTTYLGRKNNKPKKPEQNKSGRHFLYQRVPV